jgi:PLP dependent protein
MDIGTQGEPARRLARSLQSVKARITQAAQLAQLAPESVKLVAVAKNVAAQTLIQAYALGQTDFAENYVQEALAKQATLEQTDPELSRCFIWHFIGRIQQNKTRAIATAFAWVHSVAKLETAQRLNRQRPTSLPPLQLCLEVNLSGEAHRYGIQPDQLPEIALEIKQLKNLCLRGLMTMPQIPVAAEMFQRLRALLLSCNQTLASAGLPLMDTLSMGTSADLESAITHGATIVRVGRAIFGARTNTV